MLAPNGNVLKDLKANCKGNAIYNPQTTPNHPSFYEGCFA